MFSSLVAGTSLIIYPIVGLLIFFSFAIAVCFWTFHPKRRELLRSMGAAALDAPIEVKVQKSSRDLKGDVR